jgi:hypothetical protein
MRPYHWLTLLSFLTILPSVNLNSQVIAYSSSTAPESATYHQILAAQTQTRPNPAPDPGSGPRRFND